MKRSETGPGRPRHPVGRADRARGQGAAPGRRDLHHAGADEALALGADLLYHSATKFLGGHGVAIAGVLVDSGRFDWEASGKFETLTAPYAGFHGMDFEEESGTRAFLLRARREGLRDFGACMAPMTAFQILQGIETLHLRMPRHVENTRKVVAFLSGRILPEKVIYPELPDHPDYELAKKLPHGCGAVFTFEIKGGRPAGKRFIESLRLFSHLANVGDAKSLVIHPATTTHYRMSDEDLKKAGITAGTMAYRPRVFRTIEDSPRRCVRHQF